MHWGYRMRYGAGINYSIERLNNAETEIQVVEDDTALNLQSGLTLQDLGSTEEGTPVVHTYTITNVGLDTLEVDVDVLNKSGHKLPTGFPSRRVWLHLRVLHGSDVIFESGAEAVTLRTERGVLEAVDQGADVLAAHRCGLLTPRGGRGSAPGPRCRG